MAGARGGGAEPGPSSQREGDVSETTGMASLIAETPVHLDPPDPLDKLPPKKALVRSLKWPLISARGVQAKYSTMYEEEFCARASSSTTRKMELDGHFPGQLGAQLGARWSKETSFKTKKSYGRYIVLGVIGNDESIPNEVILPAKLDDKNLPEAKRKNDENLFKQIRKGIRKVRPFHRRFFSLKQISGFSLYECVPSRGYHRVPDLDDETKRTLFEFWRDFRSLGTDYEDRWLKWVHLRFNNDSCDPEHGRFALQLVLRWSPTKLAIWGVLPILLSLAIGFGYMFKPRSGEDFLTFVQTAWAIASYIITAAACKFF